MKCKDCNFFAKLKNTDECGMGICMIAEDFFQTLVDSDCSWDTTPLVCGDCERFGNDDACFTCQKDDSAIRGNNKICCGFIPMYRDVVSQFVLSCKLRGIDYKKEIENIEEETDYFIKKLQKRLTGENDNDAQKTQSDR